MRHRCPGWRLSRPAPLSRCDPKSFYSRPQVLCARRSSVATSVPMVPLPHRVIYGRFHFAQIRRGRPCSTRPGIIRTCRLPAPCLPRKSKTWVRPQQRGCNIPSSAARQATRSEGAAYVSTAITLRPRHTGSKAGIQAVERPPAPPSYSIILLIILFCNQSRDQRYQLSQFWGLCKDVKLSLGASAPRVRKGHLVHPWLSPSMHRFAENATMLLEKARATHSVHSNIF